MVSSEVGRAKGRIGFSGGGIVDGAKNVPFPEDNSDK